MADDRQLLNRYVREGSEEAFRELVDRHLNLVYSVALRRVGNDPHLARDVAQLVFTDLARKAASLPDKVILTGWLYRASRFAAAQFVRANYRRQQREQESVAMNTPESKPDWEQLRPVLDDVMDELPAVDRDAVLLRFFEQRTFAEVGNVIGSNEDAARKRVDRALEKLRAGLARRGLTSATLSVSGLIAANAVQAAPAGLAASIAGASLAAAASNAGGFLLLKLMGMTKLKLGLGAIVLAGAAAYFVVEHQTQSRLRADNEALRSQVAALQEENSALAARRERVVDGIARPGVAPAPVAEMPDSAADSFTNFIARMMRGEDGPKLTAEQARAFLEENGATAETLLAAFRTSGDPTHLEDAMRLFPNDPQVAFEAIFKEGISADERRRWLDTFKAAAPDNALANYLSAIDYFRSGKGELALRELADSSTRGVFDDFTINRTQADEEAYRSAGYSEAETRVVATFQLMLPQLKEMNQAGTSLVELAKTYRAAGDEASANSALEMAMKMGQRFDGSSGAAGVPIITQLVGIALQRKALSAMDPASPYGTSGQTVQERMNALTSRADEIKRTVQSTQDNYTRMSPEDWITYVDRTRAYGEENAIQWMVRKYGSR